jgi:hypothetical protein
MGNVIRYWTHNSSPEDFGALLKQFADRLCICGHEVKEVVHGIEKGNGSTIWIRRYDRTLPPAKEDKEKGQ